MIICHILYIRYRSLVLKFDTLIFKKAFDKHSSFWKKTWNNDRKHEVGEILFHLARISCHDSSRKVNFLYFLSG